MTLGLLCVAYPRSELLTGNIIATDGNKFTIDFDRAGRKKVLDGFVRAA